MLMHQSAAPLHHRAARCLALVALLLCPDHSLLRAQSSDALKRTILPPLTGEQQSARLGYRVAADANFIALGTPFESAPGARPGLVKVFHATTGALLHVISNPTASSPGGFGTAVALSGGRLVVGSSGDDLVCVYNLTGAAPTVPVLTLTSPNTSQYSAFGEVVAISGLRVVVGDQGDDTGAENAGSVFVFNLASATPAVPVAVLNNPALVNSGFGSAVAVAGQRVMVGAPRSRLGMTSGVGTAYLYDLAGATPTAPVGTFTNPTPVSDTDFGTAVALSGTVAAIGAPGSPTGATDAGLVYVYDVAGGTPFAVAHTLNNPTPADYDRFGDALAVSGNRVVVGCWNDDHSGGTRAGSGYVYDIASGTPAVPIATLADPAPAGGDDFGFSVAIFGTRVVAGTPGDSAAVAATGSGFVFDLTSGTPEVPVLTLREAGPGSGQKFGTATAVSGTRVVIGSPYDDTGGTDAGLVTVHDLSGATPGIPSFTLTNPNPAVQNFGKAVAVSGNRVVVGAPGGSEAVYVYDLAGTTPEVPVLTLTRGTSGGAWDFGASLAISGTFIAAGAPGVIQGGAGYGRVFVFDTAGAAPEVPVLILNNPGSSSGFGESLSLSGTLLAIGAPNNDLGSVFYAGQVFVHDLAGTTPGTAIHILQKASARSHDDFGKTLAFSGTRLAVGIPGDDAAYGNAGAVHVFDLAGATPTIPVLVINNPGPAGAVPQEFGSSVALSGTRLAAGSMAGPVDGAERVLLFNMDRAAPTIPIAGFTREDGNNAAFGLSLSLEGTTLVAGAPGYDAVLPDRGAVFIYGPATTLTQAAVLDAPVSGAVFTADVSVSFSLPETALPGTVKLSCQKNATPYVFTLEATEESAGAHSFTFSPSNPAASAAIATGTALPDGLYRVALSYQDAIGSYAATSNTATNVRVDRTAPGVAPPAGGFTPLLLAAPAVAPDYTAQAVVTDLGGISSITQNPPPGTALAAGSHPVTITATDFAGFTGTTSFMVTVLTFTQDTDGDGLNDASEVQMAAFGFNWQVAQPSLVSTLFNSANGAGLYTTSQVQALNLDVPLLTKNPATGRFKLTIGVQKSTDLQTFTPFPMTGPQTLINGAGQLEFFFTAPDNAAFFRVEPGSP